MIWKEPLDILEPEERERGSPIMGSSNGQSACLLISILMSQPRQQLVILSHSYKPSVIVESGTSLNQCVSNTYSVLDRHCSKCTG